MKIEWQVSDGYVGGRRPHTTIVDDDDLLACNNDDERIDLIYTAVQEDFEQKVSFQILTALVFDNLKDDWSLFS